MLAVWHYHRHPSLSLIWFDSLCAAHVMRKAAFSLLLCLSSPTICVRWFGKGHVKLINSIFTASVLQSIFSSLIRLHGFLSRAALAKKEKEANSLIFRQITVIIIIIRVYHIVHIVSDKTRPDLSPSNSTMAEVDRAEKGSIKNFFPPRSKVEAAAVVKERRKFPWWFYWLSLAVFFRVCGWAPTVSQLKRERKKGGKMIWMSKTRRRLLSLLNILLRILCMRISTDSHNAQKEIK